MNRLLAVASRELRERWLLFPAAFVLGFSPSVLTSFGLEKNDVPLASLAFGFMLAASAAVLTGTTMLARDTANGRLGFLFSRPLAWTTIWGGKWLAALVLVLFSGLLAALPSMVVYPPEAHGGSWLRLLTDGRALVFFLTEFVLLVGLASFAATAGRSRSPWLALDLALLVATFWLARRYVAPLYLFGVVGRSEWSPLLVLLPPAVAVFAGSAAQVALGRTDLRRAHHFLSIVFWAVMALTLAGAAGYWRWVRSAGPAELTVRALASDPAGRWIYAEGRTRRGGWYPYGYLIDTASHGYAARPTPYAEAPSVPWGALFSRDGRHAAVPTPDEHGTALVLFDLGTATPREARISLESSPPPSWRTAYALSSSAGSVFVVHESGASIYALPSGRRVATTTIPPGWLPVGLRFVAEDHARAWLVPWSETSHGDRLARAEMRVLDLATDGRTSGTTFPLDGQELPRLFQCVLTDAMGGRIVTMDSGVHLRDGATGALVATLASGEAVASDPSRPPMALHRTTAAFLSDGRVVVAEPDPATSADWRMVMRVFDREGARLAEHRLDMRPTDLSVGPEVAAGRVLVSSNRLPFLTGDTLLVDVMDGRVVERLEGLQPAMAFVWTPAGALNRASLASVVFFQDAEGRVIRIDFATGARTTVAGPGAPGGERLAVEW